MLKDKNNTQVRTIAKPPSGLGKKLGGILKFSDFSSKEGSSADQILGATTQKNSRRFRQHVLDLAMGAIAESFSASAVVLVRQSATEITNFSSSLPASWDDGNKVKFQFFGRLWTAMDGFASRNETEVSSHYQLPGNFQWVGLSVIGDVSLAASVARSSKLTEKEAATLQTLFTSIAISLGDSHQAVPMDISSKANVRKDGDQFIARVSVTTSELKISHEAKHSDEATSVASAAALCCEKKLTVVRAAVLRLDRQFLYFVVVMTAEKMPYVGIALAAKETPVGFVEAVFLAASAANAAPVVF